MYSLSLRKSNIVIAVTIHDAVTFHKKCSARWFNLRILEKTFKLSWQIFMHVNIFGSIWMIVLCEYGKKNALLSDQPPIRMMSPWLHTQLTQSHPGSFYMYMWCLKLGTVKLFRERTHNVYINCHEYAYQVILLQWKNVLSSTYSLLSVSFRYSELAVTYKT
jgi:hypothetical protein